MPDSPLSPLAEPLATVAVGGTSIPVCDVELIVAEAGLNFSGGEMLVWKRNVVVAGGRRFISREKPAANAATFQSLVGMCPRAVAIRADGAITLPRVAPDSREDPLQILSSALAAARRELSRQVSRAFTGALLFSLLGAAIIVIFMVANMSHPQAPIGFRLMVFGIVILVAGFILVIRAFTLLERRNRIVRTLRDLVAKGEFRADLLAPVIAPPSPPAGPSQSTGPDGRAAAIPTNVHPAASVSLIPATLAILGLVLMLCPFVGLVLSAVALAVTFRRNTWARTCAIIGLIVGVLTTAITLIMANVK